MRKGLKAKPQLSRWERERRRRRILAIVIAVAIVAVVGLIGYGYYDTRIKPWHQPIVRVNDRVFDMRYFVKMLRLWGAGQNLYQDMELAPYVADAIRDYELMRQEAERRGLYPLDPTEVDNKLKEYAGFDPEEQTEGEFYNLLKENLAKSDISLNDFKKMIIEPMVLQAKLREAIGNDKYPQDSQYEHVQVQAMLLGTEEEALEAKGKWEAQEFDQLIDAYSPSYYYPKDSVKWLPRGIESSGFDDFAFSEDSRGILSDPIPDTTYYTKGGYWLVVVIEEPRVEGEEQEWHIQGILLDSTVKAEEVVSKFDGENFAQLVEGYSLDSASKDNGGDLGWLTSDTISSKFGADNLAAIQALEPGVLSEPIYSATVSKQSGYWLIKVLDKQDGTLSEEHRDILTSKTFNEWLDKEREASQIENYLDNEKILWALEHI